MLSHTMFSKKKLPERVDRKVDVKDFLSFPSPTKLHNLGRDLSLSIRQELGADISDIEKAVHTIVRISTIVTDDDNKSQQTVFQCTDDILQEIFRSGNEYTGGLVANAYLVYTGLLKGEDKTYKPPSDITGPLIVLEHVIKQTYFPRSSKKILAAFMDKPNPLLAKSVTISSRLLSTLYSSC